MPAVSKAQQHWVLPYTAGIIDGEGSIGIHWHKSHKGRPRGFYSLRVTVGNTNQWLISFLQFNFGGKIITYHRSHKNPKWADTYHWTLYDKSASEFLKLVFPYLQIKRPQAELAIKFQGGKRKVRTNRKIGSGNLPLTDEEWALQEANHILMTNMNRKGIKDVPCSIKTTS